MWEKYIKDSGFDKVSIVAHSAGGDCVREIQETFADTFYSQVSSIAYTDSWVVEKARLAQPQQIFMFRNAVHYEASDEPVGTLLSANAETDTCPVVSAGHEKHEYTTGIA